MSSFYSGTSTFADYFAIPDDGDAINASSFNVGFEALGDRTVYLLNTLNTLDAFVVATGVSTTAHLATLDSEVGALYAAMQDGVWSLRSSSGTMAINLAFGGSTTGSLVFGTAIFAASGDRFDVSFTSTALVFMNSGQGITVTAQLQVSENGGGYANVSHASVTFGLPAAAGFITPSPGWYVPFCIRAVHQIVAAGNANFRILITAGFGVSATGDTVTFSQDYTGVQEQIRII
jgi:hypothetical protein